MFEGLKKTLPNINSLEEGINIYHEYYSEEDEYKYGVIAIEFCLLNSIK